MIRQHLLDALKADLVGPFLADARSPEVLSTPPSQWYLTGFLAPQEGRDVEDMVDSEGDLAAGSDKDDPETDGQEPEPKRRRHLTASVGLSVLLPPGSGKSSVVAILRYANYTYSRQPGDSDERGDAGRWTRRPQGPIEIEIPLDTAQLSRGIPVPGDPELHLVGHLQPVEVGNLAAGTQALAIFIINRRVPRRLPHRDDAFIFQVELELQHASGFVPHPSRDHGVEASWDDRLADLQYRSVLEYAVGHGVSTQADPGTPVKKVRIQWLPESEVRRVDHAQPEGIELDMACLAQLQSAEQVAVALDGLPRAYTAWIEQQRTILVDPGRRHETQQALMDAAKSACARMTAGIALLQRDPTALEAFRLANQAMDAQARARNPERYAQAPVRWRVFQLAFLLMNLTGLVDPHHPERREVELIFFPTGGGKTEAYLGVIAFLLLLRRMRGRERPDGGLGVAVLLRYTLRLLTLDQLDRAATLICALEIMRKKQPEVLGAVRFAVGLWVGKSATANTMAELQKQILLYKNSTVKSDTSPFPLSCCPWCQTEFNRDCFSLQPSKAKTSSVAVGCRDLACPFNLGRNSDGIPVLFVDEQIYRELPCFIVSTVDKFAMLPWRGETGMLFGRVRGRNGREFVGPMTPSSKPEVKLLTGLLPPELIVQDELHLIAGPLGTMVGLYETAVEALCTHGTGVQAVGPKIIASTATVRHARAQVRALFGREETNVFPPQGVDEGNTFFSRLSREEPGRLYLGVGASGRSMKVVLLRTYVALLHAAARHYDATQGATAAGDGYMTLAGYFNSLRELGGMRRLVEDEVRSLLRQRGQRRPVAIDADPWGGRRNDLGEPVELTSRVSTGDIALTRGRLGAPYSDKEPIDVLLASNMISVGIDIGRLGLMVVAGQPKTSSEYIQASSRVGRDPRWPGLVVTCYNLHKARDRSHYEHFGAYHASFYRHVEAMSLTPFSGPALERGLAGVLVAMVRLLDADMTAPQSVMAIEARLERAQETVRRFAEIGACKAAPKDAPALEEKLQKQAQRLIDLWHRAAADSRKHGETWRYSQFERGEKIKAMLQLPLSEGAADAAPAQDRFAGQFVANTSMRDVEPISHLWLMKGTLGGKEHA